MKLNIRGNERCNTAEIQHGYDRKDGVSIATVTLTYDVADIGVVLATNASQDYDAQVRRIFEFLVGVVMFDTCRTVSPDELRQMILRNACGYAELTQVYGVIPLSVSVTISATPMTQLTERLDEAAQHLPRFVDWAQEATAASNGHGSNGHSTNGHGKVVPIH
jgi:hypothetical protein